jgi:DNA-binding CsgD family transcriptional regulator
LSVFAQTAVGVPESRLSFALVVDAATQIAHCCGGTLGEPMVARRPPLLRGRTKERERLGRLLETARGGHAGVLVITGEAGVGKTALLQQAVDEAAGFRAIQIAGAEAEMELPFAALHQLCAPLLPQLDALPEPQRNALTVALGLALGDAPDRFLVGLGALTLLAEIAEEEPLLCVVDDAQWLDSASAQILAFVARRLLAESVAIVFAMREPRADGELAGLPGLTLAGLDDEDARALLASVVSGPLDGRVKDRIIAETRGNPLALLELPRGMLAAELGGSFALPEEGDLEGQIEQHYRERVDALPEATRQLMLVAAADPLGDATLVWRAAKTLGIDPAAAGPAAEAQLLEIEARVRFRHPLVRSAVYGGAGMSDRRAVHAALAAATDRETDPDRRAWHQAHAAVAPDDEVAAELIDSASRAQARGGVAAAAAFLERAVTFTSGAPERAARALTAATAKFEAAEVASAQYLLGLADAGPLDDVGTAQVQRIRAQIAFDLRRGTDAPTLLLDAARRLEPLDAELAREAYLEALLAAIYAAQLAGGTSAAEVGMAARSAPLGPGPLRARELLMVGLATRLTDGYAAAAPALTDALRAYRAEEPRLDWLCVAFNITAMELWDDAAWFELVSAQAEFARATGTLILVPYALDYLASFHVQAGDLSLADGLATEAKALDQGIRADTLPYIPLALAAWRGQAFAVFDLVEAMVRGARERGEGCAVAAADYAVAVLHNGLGQYEVALGAAQKAAASDDMATSSWALCELVEAASRSDRLEIARDAADRLSERTVASGTAWAKGTEAHSRALLGNGDGVEELHREAIEWLSQTRMFAHLARARLTYGEWLRREGRRVDAREQLRNAYDVFTSTGAAGFATRAQRELLATGEKVRKRSAETRDELTPQETQIARLARDGLTNPEIGAELFLSPRTVEWHLRKVFSKLGISSRRGLRRFFEPERPSHTGRLRPNTP